MSKTILITGSTDAIGLETAKKLLSLGHTVLIHGRNAAKLAEVKNSLSSMVQDGQLESYVADLSKAEDIEVLAKAVIKNHSQLDVLINNAGIFKTPNPIVENGLDVRFMVNTIAPYVLTQRLMPLLNSSSRIVNLSSAAQAPVDYDLMLGKTQTADEFSAYAQSKLAITMWTRDMAMQLGDQGPLVVAVNPGSLLASKMVKEGFGMPGKDINIGVDILIRAALSDDFEGRSGQYFDNDSGQFTAPHPDGLDQQKCKDVVAAIETLYTKSS